MPILTSFLHQLHENNINISILLQENSPRVTSATKTHSVLRGGAFNIEETRIRNSDDSGIPDDKTGSKSSSVSSSVSNLSSSSPGIPDSDDKTTPSVQHRSSGSAGKEPLRKSSIDIKKSQSDSSLARQAGFGKEKTHPKPEVAQISDMDAHVPSSKKRVAGLPDAQTQLPSGSDGAGGSKLYSNYKETQNPPKDGNKEPQGVVRELSTSVKDSSRDSTKQPQTSVNEPSRTVSDRGPQAGGNVKSHDASNKKPSVDRSSTSLSTKTSCVKTNAGAAPKTSNASAPKKWNGSTNPNSINTKLGGKSKPPVPVRPSIVAQTGGKTVAPSKSSQDVAVVAPSVVVEELDDGLLVSEGRLTSMGVNASVKNSKKPSSNVAPGDATARKANINSTCVAKSNNVQSGASNKQSAGNNQTNSGKSVLSKNVKPQIVPKTDNAAAPVRPPRKSRSQRSLSKETESDAKEGQSGSQGNQGDKTSQEYYAVVSSGAQMPRVGSGGSKGDTPPRPPPPSTSSGGEGSPKVPTVEQVEPPHKETGTSKLTHSNSNPTQQKSEPSKAVTTSTHVISLVKPGGEKLSSHETRPTAGITPVTSTHVISLSKDKLSPSAPNVKQIQVKPYQEDLAPSNNSPSPNGPAPSDHSGPVIVDPFESLRREREQIEREQNQAMKSREKSVLKQRQQSLYPKKVKTPDARVTSAGGRTKRTIKSAGTDKNDKSKPKNPQVKKGRKKKKKKVGNDDLMLTDRPEESVNHSNTAYVSGKGWYIHTDCNDNSDVKGVKYNEDSSDSDDDDDDTTWVQPNYMYEDSDDEDDILTTSIQRNDDSVRRSWEKKSNSIPGQIHGDESTDDANEVREKLPNLFVVKFL